LDDFSAALVEEVARWVSPEELQGVIRSDGELAPALLCLESAELLREAGPWGQGFPEPVFDGVFEVLERRIVGEKHLKLRLRNGDAALDAIAFNAPAEAASRERVHAVYRLDVNEWQDSRRLQLVIEHL